MVCEVRYEARDIAVVFGEIWSYEISSELLDSGQYVPIASIIHIARAQNLSLQITNHIAPF